MVCTGLYSAVLGCTWLYLAVLECSGFYLVVLGSTGLYWDALGCTGLYWSTGLDWALIGWGGHWSGGSCGPVIQVIQVIQVVQVVRMISIDDYIPKIYGFHGLNHQEKLRSHGCDGRRTDGKWKIGQCSVRPKTAKRCCWDNA